MRLLWNYTIVWLRFEVVKVVYIFVLVGFSELIARKSQIIYIYIHKVIVLRFLKGQLSWALGQWVNPIRTNSKFRRGKNIKNPMSLSKYLHIYWVFKIYFTTQGSNTFLWLLTLVNKKRFKGHILYYLIRSCVEVFLWVQGVQHKAFKI